MRSRIACIAAISFVFIACSSASPDESVSSENESALTTCPCATTDLACDPTVCTNGVEFALNSISANADGTYTIGGYNSKGTFRATFTASTAFRQANLNNYPSDPCRTAASQYNTITSGTITDTNVFTGPITAMTQNLCTAQVWLTSGDTSIRAFRPKAP